MLVGGAPAQGVDFLHQAYSYFPPLIAAVLLLTYLLLMRAFRSLLAAAEGGAAQPALGRARATGCSSSSSAGASATTCSGSTSSARSRAGSRSSCSRCCSASRWTTRCSSSRGCARAWDAGADNETAVAHGLERTGRIITAAAVIMCAAFSGFVAGRIVGLQEFGLGPRGRDLRRRDDRPLAARAEHDGAPRPLELVAPVAARAPRPRRALPAREPGPRGARPRRPLGTTLSEHAGNESAIGGARCISACATWLRSSGCSPRSCCCCRTDAILSESGRPGGSIGPA